MLSVDVSGLENNVIPQLKTSKEYLRVIQLLIMAINVPDDFSYGSTIHGMPSKISNIVDNLNNIENWIDKHISDFTNAENSNKNMLEKILASIGNLLGDDDKQLLKLLAYLIFNGKDNITEEDYEKARNSLKNFLEMFRYQEVVNGQFGTDQGYFKYVNDPEKLNKYTEYFSKKYNMSKSTAIQIMEYLDSIGACSYADATNLIIQKYQDSPEKFEETFGFPMYSKNEKYPNVKMFVYGQDGEIVQTEDIENNGVYQYEFYLFADDAVLPPFTWLNGLGVDCTPEELMEVYGEPTQNSEYVGLDNAQMQRIEYNPIDHLYLTFHFKNGKLYWVDMSNYINTWYI